MEGFGVLRACALAGVPAVELRAISNAIDEPDRAKWRFDDALAAARRDALDRLDVVEELGVAVLRRRAVGEEQRSPRRSRCAPASACRRARR